MIVKKRVVGNARYTPAPDARTDGEQEVDYLMASEWKHLEQQIEGLLVCSKRIVDKVYGKGYSITHPQIVTSVLQSLLMKVNIDVVQESFKELHHLVADLIDAVGSYGEK